VKSLFPALLATAAAGCGAVDAAQLDDSQVGKSEEAQAYGNCFITNGQGGFVVGGRTDYYTIDGKNLLSSRPWGVQTSNSAVVAQGLSTDGTGASVTTLFFTHNPGEAGAYVIIGGQQEQYPLNNPGQTAVSAAWGDSRGIRLDIGIDTQAYWPQWGWGGSRTILYAKRAADDACAGDQIWAGYWLSRDLKGKASGWVTDNFWGQPAGSHETWIGTGQAYSPQYGWGQSSYYLYFTNGT
jgi:hypothetical protein